MQIGYLKPTELERSLLVQAGVSDTEGELLVFRDAVLARAEVNRNRDQITAAGIDELAASIALMPVDSEHIERKVIGIFTAGRSLDSALMVDGFIYAKRFPEEASGILDGSKKLSIEAEVAVATCSICGGTFKRRSEYCDHLSDPFVSGAVRQLSGLKAVGGGTTVTPAGTDTGFNRDKVVFMASELAENDDRPLHVTLSAAIGPQEQEGDMNELEELRTQVQELLAKLATETARAETAEQKALDTEARMAEIEGNLQATVRSHDRYIRLMRAGFSETELAGIKASLATTDDAVIELLASSHSAKSAVVDPPADDDEDEDDEQETEAGCGSGDEDKKEDVKASEVVMGDALPDSGFAISWSPALFGVQ